MKTPLVFWLLLAGVRLNALEWKTRHLELSPAPLQRTVETAFEFTNTGDKAVTIRSVDTSCDCLEASPSAKSFEPGASGQINAHFRIDREGSYQRTIIVSTDDGQEPVALTVRLNIPDIATLTPRSLDWKINGPATEQTVAIVITPGVELTLGEVQSTSDAFAFRLEPVDAGRSYRLHISPKSTQSSANTAIRIFAKAGNGQDLVFSAYANIR